MLRRILMFLLCMGPSVLMAQVLSLKGSVIDSVTGEKLPFVTIIINNISTQGTSSDSAGNFSVKSSKPITALNFSFVGYKSKRFTFNSTDKTSSLLVSMAPEQMELNDVTILSGENPADRIIKTAVKNRDQNNYAKLNSYVYKAYE